MVPQIRLDASELRDLAREFNIAPPKMRLAYARALNDTGARMEVRLARQVAKQAGILVRDARKQFSSFKASPGSLIWSLNIRGGYLSLRTFNPRQTRAGVSARPWGRRRNFRGAFIIQGIGGGQVFTRRGGKLHKMWGPALPVEALRDQAPAVIENAVQTYLTPRLAHHIARALPRAKGR